ncbi:MAG: DUF2752 domain-containing protein [Clostridia bacterium]|nr:DUF2752 domain-containing protein [Clostridia bacterium]
MKKKQKDIISFVILGILLLCVFIGYGYRIPCIFHEITGFYCPGCGGTRMCLSLLKLDIYQAFRYNILLTISIPFIILHLICKYIFKMKYSIPNWFIYLLIIIVILFGVLRNIPYFSFLAPTTL